MGCNLPANRQNLDGRRNFEIGNYNGALQSFQRALHADPSNADAHYNIGRTLHHLGKSSRNNQQLKQAENAYRNALKLNPAHQPTYRGLSVLLTENKRGNEAFALLQKWSAIQPNSAEPKIEIARLYTEFGNPKTAIQVLSDALVIQNNNDRAYRAIGKLREESGDIRQAVYDYHRSLQINPMQPDLANRLAQLQLSTGIVPTESGTHSTVASVPNFPKF
ncbi:MAG: tetratricopeptide repeat protein [Planctomycetota bacterium]|nr:tetratricopeptide repeat protein [Planctomycetota bacterium]